MSTASAGAGAPAPRPPSPRQYTAVQTPPLPNRPILTTPPHLLGRDAIKFERTRLAAQPRLGLAGVLFVAAVFFPLAIGAGGIQPSLLIFAPPATFALA